MYNDYFGLRQAPFRITPDTALFYTGGHRGDVLDAMVYAINSGEGIIKVVGEVGTGKTMLCRMLEERLSDNVQIAYLANPSLTPQDILHAVALELELDVAADANRLQVMHHLQEALLGRHAKNQRVVILVEEAQSMPVDTLEEIRLLSNLETKNDKLLQIVLFGQPELDETLAKPEIRQLRERITHSFALTPLDRDEIKDYVAFRLRASGYRGRDAFTAGAYRVMSRASEGLTRRVNIIADKAMLAAFAADTHDVSAGHVKSAIADSEFSGMRTRTASRARHAPLAAMVVLSVAVAGLLGWYAGNRTRDMPVVVVDSDAPKDQLASEPQQDLAPAQQNPATPQPAPVVAQKPVAEPEQGRGPAQGPESESGTAVEPRVAAAEVVAGTALASATDASTTMSPKAVSAHPVVTAAADPVPSSSDAAPVSSSESVAGQATEPGSGVGVGSVSDAAIGKDSMRVASIQNAPPSPLEQARDESVAAVSKLAGAALSATSENAPAAHSARPSMPMAAQVPAAAEMNAKAAAKAEATPAIGSDTSKQERVRLAANPSSSESPDAQSMASGKQMHDTLLQWRLARTQRWLRSAAKNHYSIQLLATTIGQRRNLEAFLTRRERAGDIEKIFVYETKINAREWFGVLFGEFAGYTKAREALQRLPQELQLHQPFIRNIRDINALG